MTLIKQTKEGTEQGKGTKVYTVNITNIKLLISFNKTREMFPSVTRVLSILLTIAATSSSV